MTDADDITSLQEQLAAQRRTLAHLLTQWAYFDPGLVPSHVAHGIAGARAEIAQLKAALRAAGVVVGDQAEGAAVERALANVGNGPDTATSLNNLASLLESQGDYAAARPLYERALSIHEQALGPQHPDTATRLNNLAGLLQIQGEVGTAQHLHERAFAIREAALGPNHPDTAQSHWWLGTLLRQAGNYDGARERLQHAVTIYIRTLGEQHPTTQQCQRQLAALDAPPPTATQQIADITAQFEAAVAAALADSAIDRAALAAQFEARARWAEDGEQEGSPYLALAAHLRALAAQLTAPPPDEPPTGSA